MQLSSLAKSRNALVSDSENTFRFECQIVAKAYLKPFLLALNTISLVSAVLMS